MSSANTSPETNLSAAPVPVVRSLGGGFLMGLANLVPGVSGGTLILALGLYDRFIGAIADATRLRLSKNLILFLCLIVGGAAVAVFGLSGVAVTLVAEKRWIMYSLFIGLALGGVPELLPLCRPFRWKEILAVLGGLGVMAWLAFGAGAGGGRSVEPTMIALALVGALAASSMILPGISGSYVLLILGLYDLVIGSLSSSELRDDLGGALRVIVPVGVGAVLGVALLSNVLKVLLAKYKSVSHAVLLGLLLGSGLGLYPFQQPVHAELAKRPVRKAVTKVIEGDATLEEAAERYGVEPAQIEALAVELEGLSAGELKKRSDALQRFQPSGGQIGGALGLCALGFVLARALGGRKQAT